MERSRVRLGGLSRYPPEVRQNIQRQLRCEIPVVTVEYSREARIAAERLLQPEDSSTDEEARPGSGMSPPRKKCQHDIIEDLMFELLECFRRRGRKTPVKHSTEGAATAPSSPHSLDDNKLKFNAFDSNMEHSTFNTPPYEISDCTRVESSLLTFTVDGSLENLASSPNPPYTAQVPNTTSRRENSEPVLLAKTTVEAPSPAMILQSNAAIPLVKPCDQHAIQQDVPSRAAPIIPVPAAEHVDPAQRWKRFLRTETSKDHRESESSADEDALSDGSFVPDYEPELSLDESVEAKSSNEDQDLKPEDCEMNEWNEQNADTLLLTYESDGQENVLVGLETPRADLQIMDCSDDGSLCLAFVGGSCSFGNKCVLPHSVELGPVIEAARHFSDSDDLKSMGKLIRNLIHVKSPVKLDSSSAQVLELVRIAAHLFLKEKDIFLTLRMLLSPKLPCVVDICEQLLILPQCVEELPLIKQLFQRLKAAKASLESSSLQRLLSLYLESDTLGKAVQFLDAAFRLSPEFFPTAVSCARLKQLLAKQSEQDPGEDISSLLDNLAPQMDEKTKNFLKKLLPVSSPKAQPSRQMAQVREYLNQANYAKLAANFLANRYPLAEFVQEVSWHVGNKEVKAFCGLFTEISVLKGEITSLDRKLLSALNSIVLKCLEYFLAPIDFESATLVVLLATVHGVRDWVHSESYSPMVLLFSAEICAREGDPKHHQFFLEKFGEFKSRGEVDPSLYPLELQVASKVVHDLA